MKNNKVINHFDVKCSTRFILLIISAAFSKNFDAIIKIVEFKLKILGQNRSKIYKIVSSMNFIFSNYGKYITWVKIYLFSHLT